MNNPLATTIAGVTLKNPVMPASGTFGSGKEYSHLNLVDINRLGAVVTKGVSALPWKGNPPPRIAETTGGMMNSIGLQNPGVEAFIRDDIPFLRQFDTPIIVNLCGHSLGDYVAVTQRLSQEDVDMFELNISCPNVLEGGITFGTDCLQVAKVVSACKKVATKPLIVKLTPNVTDIASIAKTAQDAGADGISLINTLLGMKINVQTKKAFFYNKKAGLSGPAIMPLALRMVYEAAKAVSIPVIGLGGISTAQDALAFMMAGATAVAVGTANFSNPNAMAQIIEGLSLYVMQNSLNNIQEIVGIIE